MPAARPDGSGRPLVSEQQAMYTSYKKESVTTSSWYIGHTNGVEKKIHEYNSKQTALTRNKGSWELIFGRTFVNRSEAIEFEHKPKKHKNKHYIRREYVQYFHGM